MDELLSRSSTRGFNGVDIFLSSHWPLGITNEIIQAEKPAGGELDENLLFNDMNGIYNASIARSIKPRYHFSSAAGLFWQRAPYRNGVAGHITRFISLGCVNEANTDKEKKWLHALNLVPLTGITYDLMCRGRHVKCNTRITL